MTAQDHWSKWLLETRFGGNADAAAKLLRMLEGVRRRVLDRARLQQGETLLDVGCGDGLIAFGALERLGETGRVIFSDVSRPLLEHCERLASEAGVAERCDFVEASADDLSPIANESIHVVTTRSVLIYVRDKARAFDEFHRVLKPGGRISLFEPINRFNETFDEAGWLGHAPADVRELAERLRDFYRNLQPLDSDPMMDFDERDLLRLASSAGFERVDVEFHMYATPAEAVPWDVLVNSPGNPNIPPLRDAMGKLFSDEEYRRYEAAMRPIVEAGGRKQYSAVAYVSARKAGGSTRPDDQDN